MTLLEMYEAEKEARLAKKRQAMQEDQEDDLREYLEGVFRDNDLNLCLLHDGLYHVQTNEDVDVAEPMAFLDEVRDWLEHPVFTFDELEDGDEG